MHTPSLTTTTVPAVRFGATHGYRFVADEVELNATFIVANRSAHDRSWALQLWACPSIPARSDDLVGHLVAEAPLPPISEVAGEAEPFVVTTSAQPPAGGREHSMVLVLAARRNDGAFDEVHDVASFPERERFFMPQFFGSVSYRIAGDLVNLDIAAIENPRDASNLSGTVSLELWALPTAYAGGAFTGTPLAGAILGTLSGQDRWSGLSLELPYTAPASGTWHVVAMIREWTGSAFTTRDFASLGTLTVPPATPAVVVTPAPVPAATPVAKPAALPAEKPQAATPKAAVSATKPAKPVTAEAGKVSLNTATLEQLVAVKGMPRAVADRIVRDRPFKAIDDVMQVKGMGEKLLAKLRAHLTL